MVYNRPRTFEERLKIARDCRRCMKIEMPVLVDGIDNAVSKAYSAAPVRTYLVGRDGRIAYMEGRGPRGFRPDLVARELARMFPEARGGGERGAGADGPAGEDRP